MTFVGQRLVSLPACTARNTAEGACAAFGSGSRPGRCYDPSISSCPRRDAYARTVPRSFHLPELNASDGLSLACNGSVFANHPAARSTFPAYQFAFTASRYCHPFGASNRNPTNPLRLSTLAARMLSSRFLSPPGLLQGNPPASAFGIVEPGGSSTFEARLHELPDFLSLPGCLCFG